ncbi:MAG: hypothetical protein JST00_38380 [Deltaproteobacteria bacterium]|nr:hypothetical protein [Deltaproteobacteria bacterium]
MSSPLSSETMMKLMAYVDGELDGAERREAEDLLASDRDALRFVEQLAGGAKLVVEGYEASKIATSVATFDIADAVMASVKAEPKPEAAPRSVVPMSAKITPLELARAKRAQRLKIGGGIVAALALAAAVFVYARPSETPMAQGPSQSPTALTNNQGPAASNGPGVDVKAVESPGQNVSVFYLPTANELSTSVIIWVDENGSSGEKK